MEDPNTATVGKTQRLDDEREQEEESIVSSYYGGNIRHYLAEEQRKVWRKYGR